MSIESRIREAFDDQATWVQPHVESSLEQAHRRHSRQRRARAAGWAAVAALLVLVAWAGVERSWVGAGRPEPAGTEADAGRPTSVTGTFTVEVPSSRALAGLWTVTLRPGGTMTLLAPQGYTGVLSGSLYSATASDFRTSVFQTDLCSGAGVGHYTWRRNTRGVVFSVVEDTCAARREFFGRSSWVASTR